MRPAGFFALPHLVATVSEFETEIQVRFRDLDPMGHVNNAVYATYLEQARVRYYADVLGADLEDVDTVIAHLEVDFERPIELEESVEVRVDVPEIGRSSLPMTYVVEADGEVAATGETVQVTWDRETGSAEPIPEPWRERIADFHGLDP